MGLKLGAKAIGVSEILEGATETLVGGNLDFLSGAALVGVIETKGSFEATESKGSLAATASKGSFEAMESKGSIEAVGIDVGGGGGGGNLEEPGSLEAVFSGRAVLIEDVAEVLGNREVEAGGGVGVEVDEGGNLEIPCVA